MRRPQFFRHCCYAKSHEERGDLAAAVAELTHALHLTADPDDARQIAAWKTRLETVPSKPKARKQKFLLQSDASPAKKSPSTRKT